MASTSKIKELVSWGQLAIIISLIVGVTTVTFKLNASLKEKADKAELSRVEMQSINRDDRLSSDLRCAIERVERKQDKILEILMKQVN